MHYEDEPGQRSAAKLLTKDDARRIAVIATIGAWIVAEKVRPCTLGHSSSLRVKHAPSDAQ
jgi:hypothetical protein